MTRAPRCCAWVAAALASLLGSAAHAEEDRLPVGKIGVNMGVRQGVGQLATDYGPGVIGGVEAAVHATCLVRSVPCSLNWSVAWGWFGEDEASVAGSLHMLEMSVGARARRLVGDDEARFVVVGGGATLLRTNVPVPPDDERTYVGPYLSAGVEQLLGNSMLSFEVRYSMLAIGPGSISIMLGVGIGG